MLNGLPGWLLVVAGLALVVISLLADNLGLGGQPGMVGWKQWLGAAVGLLAALGGGSIVRRSTSGQPVASGDPTDSIRPVGTELPYYDSAAPRLPFVYELLQLLLYRHLLVNLVARDLTVRYKRSVLGLLWAMINPLLTMLVMSLVFTQIFERGVDNYPIYLLSGLLLWQLFAGGYPAVDGPHRVAEIDGVDADAEDVNAGEVRCTRITIVHAVILHPSGSNVILTYGGD